MSKYKPKKPLSLVSPRQQQGSHFEQLAAIYLQAQGLTLLYQNWHQHKVGELDLVMLESGKAWDTLVFIEVRQRKALKAGTGFGDALMSVTVAKQRKIIKAARYFLQQHLEYAECECRFDVVAYINASQPPEWVQAAFTT